MEINWLTDTLLWLLIELSCLLIISFYIGLSKAQSNVSVTDYLSLELIPNYGPTAPSLQ